MDGCLSESLEVNHGVPRGSIFGPLLYVIYTSDLLVAIHDCVDIFWDTRQAISNNCDNCGHVCCYADDSTYTVSNFDPVKLNKEIKSKYERLSQYMSDNWLVLNSDKTHLLIMTSPHRHRKNGNFGMSLNTGTEVIERRESEALLGATLSNNFQWNLHLRDGEKSVLRTLNLKNNMLKKISRAADFKSRKIVASGLILSTINYIMQVYGCCTNY